MITMPAAFKEILDTDKSQILLYGGRLGGKSQNTAILAVLSLLLNPGYDVIVSRASYGSMTDSSYEEFWQAIQSMGEDVSCLFHFKKSPLRIERTDGSGVVYFLGIGGANKSRTKSIKTRHPVIFTIIEETQELREKRNLDEALASYRRRFGERAKMIIMGNPPPQSAHWFNVFIEKKKLDKDFLVKRVTWLDIIDFINDFDLREILKTKLEDIDYYNWFYMGDSYSMMGSVYPMYRENRHMITALQFDRLLSKYPLKVVGCVIGGDGAVNRDATAFVPLLLLNNGQAVAGSIFYHDPKTDGNMGYHQLVQDHVSRWLDELCRRYHLGSPKEVREHPTMERLPIIMRIDCAAADLIQECKFFFGDRVDVKPYKKEGGIMVMVGRVQSAISNDNIVILDYGGHFSYVRNQWVRTETPILSEQIRNLIWNENQNGYDPIVPNDACDAFTYGVNSWYGNPENLQYFNILKARNLPNMLIRDIIENV